MTSVREETRFDATDDARVGNNSARQQDRKLSDEEKATIDSIKGAGQDVIDCIEGLADAGRTFVSMMNKQLDHQSPDANVALRRAVEALGIESDFPEESDTHRLSFPELHTKTIQFQEAIMWAVRSITA